MPVAFFSTFRLILLPDYFCLIANAWGKDPSLRLRAAFYFRFLFLLSGPVCKSQFYSSYSIMFKHYVIQMPCIQLDSKCLEGLSLG